MEELLEWVWEQKRMWADLSKERSEGGYGLLAAMNLARSSAFEDVAEKIKELQDAEEDNAGID